MKDDFFETNDIHFLLYCIVKFMEREKRRIPMSLKSVFRGYDRSLKTIQPGFLSDIYIYLSKQITYHSFVSFLESCLRF